MATPEITKAVFFEERARKTRNEARRARYMRAAARYRRAAAAVEDRAMTSEDNDSPGFCVLAPPSPSVDHQVRQTSGD